MVIKGGEGDSLCLDLVVPHQYNFIFVISLSNVFGLLSGVSK